jgi:hypothetical protein
MHMSTKKVWRGETGEPGIRKYAGPQGQRWYRVQLGGRGRGQRPSTVCPSLADAVAVKARWLAEGLPAAGSDRVPLRRPRALTIDDGLRHYAKLLAQPRLNDGPDQAHDRAEQVHALRRVLDKVHPELSRLPISHVTAEDLEEFIRRRRAQPDGVTKARLRSPMGCMDNTIGRNLITFRAMLKLTRPDFGFPKSLFPALDLTRLRMLPPGEEQQALYDDIALRSGPRFARLAKLALLLVCRQQDMRLLTRPMVRLREGVLLLPARGRKAQRPTIKRLSREAIELLETQLAENESIRPGMLYVFGNPRTDRPYSRHRVWQTFHRSAVARGLEDFTFHDQRHHGPTLAVNDGANAETLMALLDVTTPSVVRRYAHVLNPTIERYLELISQHGKPADSSPPPPADPDADRLP